MSKTSNENFGGVELERGRIWEYHSLLLYILLRRLQWPELVVEFQPSEGEDATLIYTGSARNGGKDIREIVQCKKREASGSGRLYSGTQFGDPWHEGQFRVADLRKWLTERRKGTSAEDLLTGQSHMFYTALVGGSVNGELEHFVPEEIRGSLGVWWIDPLEFRNEFPVDHSHRSDPGGAFTSERVRRRVRVLPLGPPRALRMLIEACLKERTLYGLSASRVDDVREAFYRAIRDRSNLRYPGMRTWSPGEIRAVLDAGKGDGPAAWRDARTELGYGDPAGADLARGDWPRWADFEEGRYIRTEAFDAALRGLETPTTILYGPGGCGRSVLARYLAYEYLKGSATRRAYFLHVRPDQSLVEELQFLKLALSDEVLFVVEDESRSRDAGTLIRAFLDRDPDAAPRAKLVVTSIRTFAPERLGGIGGHGEVFATSIHLHPLEPAQLEELLSAWLRKTSLTPALTVGEMAELSRGDIGLTMLFARMTDQQSKRLVSKSLFAGGHLKLKVRDYVLSRLGRPTADPVFQDEIVPVFILLYFQVAIPADFAGVCPELQAAGFLSPADEMSGDYTAFQQTLPQLVFRQHSDSAFDVLESFLVRYPHKLPVLWDRLAQSEAGRHDLKRLCTDRFSLVSGIFRSTRSELSLDEIRTVLRGAHLVARHEARQLLRGFTMPDEQPHGRLFREIFSTASGLGELARFIEVILRIDQRSTRNLAERQLSTERKPGSSALGSSAEAVRTHFLRFARDSATSLEDLAICLHSLRKCSHAFAALLYGEIVEEGLLARKVAESAAREDAYSARLAFCEHLVFLDRSRVYEFLKQWFNAAALKAYLRGNGGGLFFLTLLRLHRLYPRYSEAAVAELWRFNPGEFQASFRALTDLGQIGNGLYSVSRVNRKIAGQLGFALQDHLLALVQEASVRKIGSFLGVASSSVSLRLAEEIAGALPPERLLEGLRGERFPGYLGRTLTHVAALAPELGVWLQERIDWRATLRISRSNDLRQLAHFVQGMLAAVAWEKEAGFRDELLNSQELRGLLSRSWSRANNRSEIAAFLNRLMHIPLGTGEISAMLDLPNEATLERDLVRHLSRETSHLHFTNLLYVMARLFPNAARRVWRSYVVEGASGPSRPDDGPEAETVRVSVAFEPDNLVDLGNLLEIASAIDAFRTHQYASDLDVRDLIETGREETNLGRHAIFLNGLARASRKVAREYVAQLSDAVRPEQQFLENEEIEQVVGYTRALSRVNAEAAATYTGTVAREFGSEILAMLAVRENLATYSDWYGSLTRGLHHLESRPDDAATTRAVRDHRDQVAGAMIEAAAESPAIHGLLSGALACATGGSIAEAVQLANHAVTARDQLRRARALSDFLPLLFRTEGVGTMLGWPDLVDRVFSSIEAPEIVELVRRESSSLLAAFAAHVLSVSIAMPSPESASEMFSLARASADRERDPVLRAFSLLFARAEPGKVSEAVEEPSDSVGWVYGLGAIAFGVIHPGLPNPWLTPRAARIAAESLRLWSEHMGDIELGLCLVVMNQRESSPYASEPEIAGWRADAAARALEVSGAPHALLRRCAEGAPFAPDNYQLWSILRRMFLRTTYISREEVIERAVEDTLFGGRYGDS